MLISHRQSDAVIAIYQDNSEQQTYIHDLNDVAADMLGFGKGDLIGQPIGFLLPTRIHKLLEEYVEYEDFGNDVGSVLGKVNSFCVVNKDRQELTFRIKVQRSTPVGGHDQFNLILQSEAGNRRTEAFRELLRENFKGHEVLDNATGLPNRASLLKDIELVMFYVHKKELKASVAMIDLEDLEQHQQAHGDKGVAEAMKHIAMLSRQNLRNDDTIGLVSPGRVGIILFDAVDDAAQMVLNRLRWLIAANACTMPDDQKAALSVRVAFTNLEPDSTKVDSVLDDLEASLDSNEVPSNRVHQTSVD